MKMPSAFVTTRSRHFANARAGNFRLTFSGHGARLRERVRSEGSREAIMPRSRSAPRQDASPRRRSGQDIGSRAVERRRSSSTWRIVPLLTLALLAGFAALMALSPNGGAPDERHGAEKASAGEVTATAADPMPQPAPRAARGPAGTQPATDAAAAGPEPAAPAAPEKAALTSAPSAAGPAAASATAAAGASSPPPATAARADALPDTWVRIASPIPTFQVEALAGQVLTYETVRHPAGGGRDDAVSVGHIDEAGAMVRLSLYRPGREAQSLPPFFIDMVRRAGEAGLAVERLAVPQAVTVRAGRGEVAQMTLAAAGPARRHCLAFRFVREEPALRLSGWYCEADAPPVPGRLACLIDSIRWKKPTDEPALAALLTGQTQGAGCAVAAIDREPRTTGALPQRAGTERGGSARPAGRAR